MPLKSSLVPRYKKRVAFMIKTHHSPKEKLVPQTSSSLPPRISNTKKRTVEVREATKPRKAKVARGKKKIATADEPIKVEEDKEIKEKKRKEKKMYM